MRRSRFGQRCMRLPSSWRFERGRLSERIESEDNSGCSTTEFGAAAGEMDPLGVLSASTLREHARSSAESLFIDIVIPPADWLVAEAHPQFPLHLRTRSGVELPAASTDAFEASLYQAVLRLVGCLRDKAGIVAPSTWTLQTAE